MKPIISRRVPKRLYISKKCVGRDRENHKARQEKKKVGYVYVK